MGARIPHPTVVAARFSSMIRANRAERSPSPRRLAKFTCPTVVLHDNTGLDRSAWISCPEHRFLRLVTYRYFQTIISRRRKIYGRRQCLEKWPVSVIRTTLQDYFGSFWSISGSPLMYRRIIGERDLEYFAESLECYSWCVFRKMFFSLNLIPRIFFFLCLSSSYWWMEDIWNYKG